MLAKDSSPEFMEKRELSNLFCDARETIIYQEAGKIGSTILRSRASSKSEASKIMKISENFHV